MLIAKLNRNGTRCSKGFWLSGIVLDSRLRGHGFEPRGASLSSVPEQDTFIIA